MLCAADAHTSVPRKTASRKQLQFAPLQLDPPDVHMEVLRSEGVLLSPDSRSRSVGFDRAAMDRIVRDAEVAKAGSRPVSASLFGKVRGISIT